MSYLEYDKAKISSEKYKKEITSVCPECIKVIPAVIEEDPDGKIRLKKKCPEHGEFEDILSQHPDYYKWSQNFLAEGVSIDQDKRCVPDTNKGCPWDCGTCQRHKTTPILTLIDITNKCNLRCPICFANAAVTGNVVEPTFDEVVKIMKHLRSLTPYSNVAVSFSGGEPTLREELPDMIRKAYELDFLQVMLITNGIKFKNLDYCKEIKETGLQTIYLQFDGTLPETWEKTRGFNLWPIKQRIIKNLRIAGFDSVILVPTVAKGVSDHEVGNIIQFAIDNLDIIRGVNFQPVSLCGRIPPDKLAEMRINISDLIHKIDTQTNHVLNPNVWYPVPVVAPMANLITWYTGVPGVDFGCHPDCGFATFMVLNDKTGELECITDYIDVPEFFKLSNKYWAEVSKRKNKFHRFETIAGGINEFLPFNVPFLNNIGKGLDGLHEQTYKRYVMARFFLEVLGTIKKTGRAIQSVSKILLRTEWDDVASFMYDTLMVSCMHFQDLYSMRTARTERCIIHYAVHDRRDGMVKQIPFCTYNSIHRPLVEKAIAVPISQVDEGEVLTMEKEYKEIQKEAAPPLARE
ncbi:MAG: radical SAM protein [Candidatus Helarchaeota archaeon]|nr:radical SAM protein [Candidatus Helarchaeota archaeon]